MMRAHKGLKKRVLTRPAGQAKNRRKHG